MAWQTGHPLQTQTTLMMAVGMVVQRSLKVHISIQTIKSVSKCIIIIFSIMQEITRGLQQPRVSLIQKHVPYRTHIPHLGSMYPWKAMAFSQGKHPQLVRNQSSFKVSFPENCHYLASVSAIAGLFNMTWRSPSEKSLLAGAFVKNNQLPSV